jgi:BirA family biotin operon repressor/biotin-[acetyl-CoA-carboxylase] ligase
MLTPTDLRRALEAIREAAPVHAHDEVGSTNTVALELAAAGAPQWTLVSAAHQTEGRGRRDRSWTDVPGGAVMCTVLLRPTIEPARAGLLSLLAGAALARAIRAATGAKATCKWPNDVLVDEGKVAGVLGESVVADGRLSCVVVGFGVNVRAPGDVPGAAAIGPVEPGALLTGFLEAFHEVYVLGEPDLADRVKAAWLPLNATIGREVEVTVASGAVVRGRAVGLDRFGGLVLSSDEGERSVSFGEVTHLDPAG